MVVAVTVVVVVAVTVAIVVVILPGAFLIRRASVVMVASARVGDRRAAVVGGGRADAQPSQYPGQETAEHPTPRTTRRQGPSKLVEAFPLHATRDW